MYTTRFRWHRATTFAQASEALVSLGADAKLIAGGQTLIPMMKLRVLKPTDLIDIAGIRGADSIASDDHGVQIGALARHYEIGTSSVAARYPILRDCALGIADTQVRNLGTIGGGLAEADPSSCWPTLLIGLDAVVNCIGPQGRRAAQVRDFLVDAYSPALETGEIIESLSIPLGHVSSASAFVAFKRSAPAYPTASCALSVTFDADTVSSVHIGIGCAALVPYALPDVEANVPGMALSESLISDIAQHAADSADPFDDNRGTAAYKRSLVASLVLRAFKVIASRRRGEQPVETHTYYG